MIEYCLTPPWLAATSPVGAPQAFADGPSARFRAEVSFDGVAINGAAAQLGSGFELPDELTSINFDFLLTVSFHTEAYVIPGPGWASAGAAIECSAFRRIPSASGEPPYIDRNYQKNLLVASTTAPVAIGQPHDATRVAWYRASITLEAPTSYGEVWQVFMWAHTEAGGGGIWAHAKASLSGTLYAIRVHAS
jgi:hypothetical protein